MPKTIVLDKVGIENVQLFRGAIEIDGETQTIWKLGINYTMTGQDEAHQGGTKIFDLIESQQGNVKSFLKPFVVALKEELDIQDGEEWTDQE